MCTRCGSLFEEGMDILEGCPVCGWNKFLFVKSKEKIKEVRGALKASEIGGPYEPSPEGDDSLRKSEEGRGRRTALEKKDRQEKTKEKRKPKKRAPEGGKSKERDERKHGFFDLASSKEPSPDQPLQRPKKILHQEDKTLESIRMPEPGTYELNLPSLFERDELVMAVKDGTYLIDLSSAFKKQKKG